MLSQPPSLMLKTNITHFSTDIECDITGFTATKIRFYENLNEVVHIGQSGQSCAKWFSGPPNYFDCTCIINKTAVCTIDVDRYGKVCPKWQCAVLNEGVLHYSNYIDVCNSNKTHFTTKIIDDADCSGRIPFRVKWTIFGLKIKHNMITSILKTFITANISSFVEKYTSYQHASIATCTLKKRESENWNLSILDASLLCSSNSDMPHNKTCKATDGNPMVTVIREPNIRSQCQSIRTTPAPDTLTLCEAVNRKDLGAKRYVGNMTGLFKLEILVTASVMKFFVEGFNNQTHITFNETTKITLRCQGDGFPSPTMHLLKNGIEYSVGNSPFRPTMTLNGSQDTGNYTCIAANALGKDNKTVYISSHIKMDNHQDQPPDSMLNMKVIVTIIAGTGALVLLVIIVSAACVYRFYIRMKTTENVVLPMTHVTTTTPTTSSIPLREPTLIYNEIDPQMMDSDRPVEDDNASNVSQYSLGAAAEGFDDSRYLDESPLYLIVTD
ncbi:hypothetical protein DPMN_030451 [Dreissena polymorpha]|uniref:Ig-like domain-containing protein n=2 Tax=Dreissena polymorpha TaxID=45954 RepID=A0A9D4LZZ3_DREPO|nr:hypothetical protein DPMN_030451 [Dreissena polymorpha]